ncbi:MAG: DUF721 domain-containing protein [Deltaproteobacteria bacterium]|nr:DUF721 domain-containing protein [Deltaproteobacteria bacterium]
MKGGVPVSAALEEALANLGLATVMIQVRLASRWEEIAGGFLSGKTFPSVLRRGVLTVLVESHPLAQELSLSKPLLLRKIRDVAGEEAVRDIRFRVGPLPAAGRIRTGAGEGASGRAAALLPDGLDRIADPETREILLAIARKAAARRPGKGRGEGTI